MSYSLFKAELFKEVFVQHKDPTKFARAFSTAYNNLITRHFESLTGGGVFVAASAGLPGLIQGVQTVMDLNKTSRSPVNFFQLISPYIYTYWIGQTAIGPTGVATVIGTGSFTGAPIPQNSDINIFVDVLIGVISTHLLSLTGTYINAYTGITTPWSGALMFTFP